MIQKCSQVVSRVRAPTVETSFARKRDLPGPLKSVGIALFSFSKFLPTSITSWPSERYFNAIPKPMPAACSQDTEQEQFRSYASRPLGKATRVTCWRTAAISETHLSLRL